MLHKMGTGVFRTLDGKVSQNMLRTSGDQLCWNKDSPELPISFGRIVQIFLDGMANCLKCSALVAYPMSVVLLNFSKAYKKRLMQIGHSLVAFSS